MRHRRDLIVWAVLAVAAVIAMPWLFRQAFPYFPDDWSIRKDEAEALALEQLRDLGELPGDPYVVSTLAAPSGLELRLQRAVASEAAKRDSRLARNLLYWNVQVYAPGAPSGQLSFAAQVTVDGRLLSLQRFLQDEEGQGVAQEAAARRRAEAFLDKHGFDLDDFQAPDVRVNQRQDRTDLTFRFQDRSSLLAEDISTGMAVTFVGDELTGFSPYLDDPRDDQLQELFQPLGLAQQGWIFIAIPLLPLISIFFVRRYHAGEIGVRRGLQIGAVVTAGGALVVLFAGRAMAAGWNLGILSREQTSLVVCAQIFLLFFIPMAILAFLSWSVGEVWCRESKGRLLAGFDALFQRDWHNATVAREAWIGLAAGLVVVAGQWLTTEVLRSQGVVITTGMGIFGPWWEDSTIFVVPLLSFGLAYALFMELFGRLFLVSGLASAFGWPGRIAAVLLGAVLFFPPIFSVPLLAAVPTWILFSALMAFLFLRYGILTAVLANLTAFVVAKALPMVWVEDPAYQAMAAFALVVPALPFLLTFRSLGSGREFVYRWEDVPPHVRRIAERERQRVELETARGIQSSILPQLPPQLNGVELAHAYLPATEVGGDFYDVLALEDGRLALAVGDVAGHGVSSGLVMSMAKSALAVQVTFDPEVAAVFRTLNRTVFQTARRRLLTTLCYAVLDPEKRELLFASAGHLFPYRISKGGVVQSLESVAYPLGVRGDLQVEARKARLESGDTLFLFSDGVVEARPEGSDELFGFERLEESLRRHAGESPERLRDRVLEDVERFVGPSPREDDQTVLVLRVP